MTASSRQPRARLKPLVVDATSRQEAGTQASSVIVWHRWSLREQSHPREWQGRVCTGRDECQTRLRGRNDEEGTSQEVDERLYTASGVDESSTGEAAGAISPSVGTPGLMEIFGFGSQRKGGSEAWPEPASRLVQLDANTPALGMSAPLPPARSNLDAGRTPQVAGRTSDQASFELLQDISRRLAQQQGQLDRLTRRLEANELQTSTPSLSA